MKGIAIAAFVASFTCLAIGGIQWWKIPNSGVRGAWEILPQSRSIGVVPVGSEIELTYRAVNYADDYLYILGSDERCDGDGCLLAEGLPMTIAPRGDGIIKITTTFSQPADYEKTLTVYASRAGRREFALTLKGQVVGVDGNDWPPRQGHDDTPGAEISVSSTFPVGEQEP